MVSVAARLPQAEVHPQPGNSIRSTHADGGTSGNGRADEDGREINNDLPADLHNYFVQICMSSDGVYATAIPLEDTYKDNDE